MAGVTVQSGAATDLGRLRQSNQDCSVAVGGMFAVADGMGGHAAGEIASGLAAAHLVPLGERLRLKPDDVRAVLDHANSEILASAERSPERAGMGTTVAGLCLVHLAGSEHWMVFNIGDSRVYRFAAEGLTQLTVDHSEVGELLAAGLLSQAESRRYPRSNVVTRALGTTPAPELDFWVFPPTEGDRFLICSDGLTLELGDEAIAEVLRDESTAQQAADALVRMAVQAGGRDNVTVLIIDHVPMADSLAGDTVPRIRVAKGN